jgi:hypothetical protein
MYIKSMQLKKTLVICIQTIELAQLTNSVAPEPEGSSPHSQQPANGPYPEPGESTPHPSPPQPISLRSILIPSSHLRLGLPSGVNWHNQLLNWSTSYLILK